LPIITKRKPHRVIANINRPCGKEITEPRRFIGKKRPSGLFKTGKITRNSQHEVISAFVSFAQPVFCTACAPRFFDQLSQRHRCPAGLSGKPFPMPGEQGDFAWHHPQFGTPATLETCECGRIAPPSSGPFNRNGGEARNNIRLGASGVDVDGTACFVVEDQDRPNRLAFKGLLDGQGVLYERAGSDATVAVEAGVRMRMWLGHDDALKVNP
jgi:hypothetical protein